MQGMDIYRQKFEQIRSSRYMDYPILVHIETLAKCNAACDFCPYPTLKRQGVRMPMALIKKIFTDLSDVPQDMALQLSLMKVNEPFLDKRLFDIINLAAVMVPNAHVTLTSNASPITDAAIEKLAKAGNVSALWLSVNESDPERYQKLMKLPFARTKARLDAIHGAVVEGRLKCRVMVSRVGQGGMGDLLFSRWAETFYPRFGVHISPRDSWIGQAGATAVNVPDVVCKRWFELSITATGEVAHCCMDGQCEWPIGNVTETHVLDVYNSPDYRRLREKTGSRLDVDPCRNCAFP